MLIGLSFLICLAADECRTVAAGGVPSLVECERVGMLHAAEVEAANPGWRVAKVRCSIGNQRGDVG